jgi:hypothetical protein
MLKVSLLILQFHTTLTHTQKCAATAVQRTRATAVAATAKGRSKVPPKGLNYRMVGAGKEVPANADSVPFVVPASYGKYLDLLDVARRNETEEKGEK